MLEFPIGAVDSAVASDTRARFPRGYALINPGAAWPNKQWPPERFGAVADLLQQRFDLPSVVLWGPGEAALAEAVGWGTAETNGGTGQLKEIGERSHDSDSLNTGVSGASSTYDHSLEKTRDPVRSRLVKL